jgi:hypothetical protein
MRSVAWLGCRAFISGVELRSAFGELCDEFPLQMIELGMVGMLVKKRDRVLASRRSQVRQAEIRTGRAGHKRR